jgi:hypothetical protein
VRYQPEHRPEENHSNALQSLIAGDGKVIQLGLGTDQVIEIEPGQTMRVRLQGGPAGKGPQIVTEKSSAADSVKADRAGKVSKTQGDSVAPAPR